MLPESRAGSARPIGLVARAAALLVGSVALAVAQEGAPGLTTPVVLPSFDPNAAACTPPPDLRKALAFAQDNEREFIQGVDNGLAMAAKDRGLEYEVALAANDPQQQIEQLQELRESKIGAVAVGPVNPSSLASSVNELIWSGA